MDIVEVGFLRKADDYRTSEDITRWEDVGQIEKILPKEKGSTLFSAMCIHNFYDTKFLPDAEKSCIDILRVTFHDYDFTEGLEFCRKAMKKGYRVSCNPINIMGYGDADLLLLLNEVNRLHPYAFSIGYVWKHDAERFGQAGQFGRT